MPTTMKHFVISLFFFYSLILRGQDESPSFLVGHSFELYGGSIMVGYTPLTLDEFKKVAPASALVQSDFSGYKSSTSLSYGSSLDINTLFGARVAFKHLNKKKSAYSASTMFFVGANFSSIGFNGPYYFREKRSRHDTLVTGNNETYYVDSIARDNYDFSWYASSVSLEVGQIFHTKENRLVNCWFGYGLNAGAVVGGYTYAEYSHNSMEVLTTFNPDSVTYMANGYGYSNTNSNYTHEQVSTPVVMNFRAFFPMGIALRFSRKDRLASQFAFYFQSQFGVALQKVPGIGMRSSTFASFETGFRFYFKRGSLLK
ncbi:MAG TPA: hypothetical protein VI731_04765 [Bacteroidia bacterium]|nr:hypothetical protein [Bacteroidia bacterium]